ncbi:alkane 1-monooxygenase [Legionella lytica]|uniref:Alkane 1-monooxygenase n=1 Tax=Legionella lytica TaxID=96232 RepID=A0ABY4Y9V2_9GAMM|nr:alkane 1-monooxygenase [Legionella lytica]USQ14433.1 alkane 1-monooxygenase [Legionella lytica]
MKSRYWYLLVFIFPLSAIIGFVFSGVASYATFFFFSMILPAAEFFCGEDYVNPHTLETDSRTYYRGVLYGVVISQVILTFWGAYAASHSQYLFEAIGYAVAVGINGGIAFCAAHELIHKNNRFDNWMGNIVLIFTATGHAPMEHVLVHHGPFITGTPADHVHAPDGMNFYTYYLKSMVGLRTSAFAAEKKLMRRKGYSLFSLHNRLVTLNLATFLLALFLTIFWGYVALFYFIGVVLVSSIVILGAAYIQHYGLERFTLPDGSYEKFSAMHCWNSNYILTNYLLFQLPRHSIHHLRPGRDYEVSVDSPENPQLPYGYFVCSLLIFIPGWWRKLMEQPVQKNLELRRRAVL